MLARDEVQKLYDDTKVAMANWPEHWVDELGAKDRELMALVKTTLHYMDRVAELERRPQIDVEAVMEAVAAYGNAMEQLGSEPCPKGDTIEDVDDALEGVRAILEGPKEPPQCQNIQID